MYIEDLGMVHPQYESTTIHYNEYQLDDAYVRVVPRSQVAMITIIPRCCDQIIITNDYGKIVKCFVGNGEDTLLELYLDHCRFRKLNALCFDLDIF